MDRSGGRVNPAQLRGDFELLGTERPGDDDFGIAEMVFDAVVAGQMDDFELREILAEPLGKPRRGIPKFETVMEDDKKLHHRMIW